MIVDQKSSFSTTNSVDTTAMNYFLQEETTYIYDRDDCPPEAGLKTILFINLFDQLI